MLLPTVACGRPAAVSGPLAINLFQQINFCVFSDAQPAYPFVRNSTPATLGGVLISSPLLMGICRPPIWQLGLGGLYPKVNLL